MASITPYNWNFTLSDDNISTLKSCVDVRPDFPLGKICGTMERCSLQREDVEGGLRTKGFYKRNTKELPLITYITVVRNRAGVIRRCMESVFGQSYSNIEYIVIDGASTDGTLELIMANEGKIDYFVSQPDTGIYNAMNKGIALASGHFICMINSDDVCALNAAEIIAERYRLTGADLICGRVDNVIKNKIDYAELTPRFLIPMCAARYTDLNHQALYASRTAFETVGKFDENYSIIADYKWEILCVERKLHFDLIDNKLALFSYNGVSSTDLSLLNREYCIHVREKFPFLSKRQAVYYYYGMTYGFSFREFLPLFRAFEQLLNVEKSFRIATYRAALYVCFCDCRTINKMANEKADAKHKADIWANDKIKALQKFGFEAPQSMWNLCNVLEEKLVNSLEEDDSCDYSNEDFILLGRIKKLCNIYYDRFSLMAGETIVDKLARLMRLCIKSVVTNNLVLSTVFMQRIKLKKDI